MSREIKFRVWNESAKRHSKPFTLKCDVLNFTDDDGIGVVKSLTNEIIEQFTGLTDKNGKEIYGNDLMKDNEGCIFRIYHVYAGFVVKAAYWAKNIKELIPADELIFEPLSEPQNASWIQNSCEVIGNIHEDKHLLK
jgi:uncharacterized phage protein (TIGR01671 family)